MTCGFSYCSASEPNPRCGKWNRKQSDSKYGLRVAEGARKENGHPAETESLEPEVPETLPSPHTHLEICKRHEDQHRQDESSEFKSRDHQTKTCSDNQRAHAEK